MRRQLALRTFPTVVIVNAVGDQQVNSRAVKDGVPPICERFVWRRRGRSLPVKLGCNIVYVAALCPRNGVAIERLVSLESTSVAAAVFAVVILPDPKGRNAEKTSGIGAFGRIEAVANKGVYVFSAPVVLFCSRAVFFVGRAIVKVGCFAVFGDGIWVKIVVENDAVNGVIFNYFRNSARYIFTHLGIARVKIELAVGIGNSPSGVFAGGVVLRQRRHVGFGT